MLVLNNSHGFILKTVSVRMLRVAVIIIKTYTVTENVKTNTGFNKTLYYANNIVH